MCVRVVCVSAMQGRVLYVSVVCVSAVCASVMCVGVVCVSVMCVCVLCTNVVCVCVLYVWAVRQLILPLVRWSEASDVYKSPPENARSFFLQL